MIAILCCQAKNRFYESTQRLIQPRRVLWALHFFVPAAVFGALERIVALALDLLKQRREEPFPRRIPSCDVFCGHRPADNPSHSPGRSCRRLQALRDQLGSVMFNVFGQVEAAATMASAALDAMVRLGSAYTTNAAHPATFMQHGLPQICHLASTIRRERNVFPREPTLREPTLRGLVFAKIYPAGALPRHDYER
jgi:hypothetical protein